jgi:hypothetical protein
MVEIGRVAKVNRDDIITWIYNETRCLSVPTLYLWEAHDVHVFVG